MICDHILGIGKTSIRAPDGTQRAEIRDEITASFAKWKEGGVINLWWDGPHYKFCPLCGIELGNYSVGLRI